MSSPAPTRLDNVTLAIIVGGVACGVTVAVGVLGFLLFGHLLRAPAEKPPVAAVDPNKPAPPKPVPATPVSVSPIPSAPMPAAPLTTPPPSEPIDFRPNTGTLVSARYGIDTRWVDATKVLKAHLAADPLALLQADDRSMGDPAFGVHKNLEIVYELDGKQVTQSITKFELTTIPPWPKEGVALPDASQNFRIVAARYGIGTTWFDATALVRQRVAHPGEPASWSAFSWDDPWYGEYKHTAVWYDFGGKRHLRIFRDGQQLPVVEGHAPPASQPFAAEFKRASWGAGMPTPASVAANGSAFGILTELNGNFLESGATAGIDLDAAETWSLQGESRQPLAVHGLGVVTPLREKFESEVTEYRADPGQPPTRMIPSSEGFCILSRVTGSFAGPSDAAWVTINPQDGYWYLELKGKATGARARAFKLKPNAGVKVRCAEFGSHNAALRILPANKGFCYLSGVRGGFRGLGERAVVQQSGQGAWELSAQNCYARAFAVMIE